MRAAVCGENRCVATLKTAASARVACVAWWFLSNLRALGERGSRTTDAKAARSLGERLQFYAGLP